MVGTVADFYPVEIELDGKRYAGQWKLRQGGMICVGGFWGSKTVPLGRAKPEVQAAKILRVLVVKWQAGRAKEQRAWEAKRARLSPNG